MKFKYSHYLTPDGKIIYRPSLSIIFRHGENFIYTEAIIDSGADYTVLPIELAGILKVDLDIREKKTFYGAGKNPFIVYPSGVKITHLLRQAGFRPIEWETIVYFAESQPAILLGNNGFLNNFRVLLDGVKKEVEVTT